MDYLTEPLRGPRPATLRRMEQIRAMVAQGRSYADIGRELGISRQRVHQIVNRRADGSQYCAPYMRKRTLKLREGRQ